MAREPRTRVAVTLPVGHRLAPHGPGRLGWWSGGRPWRPGTTVADLSESRVLEIEHEIANGLIPLTLTRMTGGAMIPVCIEMVPAEQATCYALAEDGTRYLFLGTYGDDGAPLCAPAGANFATEVTPAQLDALCDAIRRGNHYFSIRRLS